MPILEEAEVNHLYTYPEEIQDRSSKSGVLTVICICVHEHMMAIHLYNGPLINELFTL